MVKVGEIRTQNVPEVMELTKILKVFLESHVEKVGQICTDCLGGGRMVMAKSLFTIVLAVGKSRGEFTNLCRFF